MSKKRPYKAMALMTGILSQLVGCILIGLFGGRWIDSYIETGFPIFLILGLFLGLATGVYGTIRLINNFSEDGQK
ncbi:AtpZ/AtpI family protein [Fictibacillus iocasae]|uniref:AtpZ/AtpI family protein n=1 Tax=Fictibacillus iocasae TaxID=2715437 RepID=A0ABW2NQM5_9BACL